MLGHLAAPEPPRLAMAVPGWRYSLVVLWLGAYLTWGSLLTQRLWLHGWHSTPEQWAYHALMEQLGVLHHHGYVDDGAPIAPDAASTPSARGIGGPDLVAAQMASLAGPGDASSLLTAAVGILCVGVLPIARLVSGCRPLRTRFREPPEPPPPTSPSI